MIMIAGILPRYVHTIDVCEIGQKYYASLSCLNMVSFSERRWQKNQAVVMIKPFIIL
jgi:hypothetical protein